MGQGEKEKNGGTRTIRHISNKKCRYTYTCHLMYTATAKVQTDNVMKNSRVSGQLALNGVLVR